MAPDIFIKIAEARGFVGEITKLVVRHTLRDFGAVLRHRPDFRLSINVAAADLGDSGFLPMLDRPPGQAGVQAQSLAIEITEGCTAGDRLPSRPSSACAGEAMGSISTTLAPDIRASPTCTRS